MKPICVPCRRFFRPKKNGVYFVEGMPRDGVINPEPGARRMAEDWQPYKLWVGDLYQCQGCGSLTIVGVGGAPIAERHHPGFEEKVRLVASMMICDC